MEIDYEELAKEALDRVVDDQMKDELQEITELMAKVLVKGDTATASVLKAAIHNWYVVGLVRSASEAEDLAIKIFDSLGTVLVSIGKKALGLPT